MTIDINAIASEFTEQLDRWYSLPETYDNELDRQIHEWYANPPQVWPKRPYFSPSSSKACPRELYVKATGAKKDAFPKQPHQGRWQEIGTSIGDLIQRTVLAMERNLPGCPFRFERNADNTPMFEDFAKKNHRVEHNGQTFYLYGTTDGIMEYATEDGEILRVGLEIKSKQSTPSKTSLYSMKEAEEGHRKQCVAYSIMYDVDYFIILYVNASKKSWNLTEEEYAANPDIRAFGFEITDADRNELLDFFAEITRCVNAGTPPSLDLSRWTFNNFKTACAKSLTDDEFAILKAQVKRALKSSLPDWKKQAYYEAFEFIREVREGLDGGNDDEGEAV
ncbi:hypothetical protein [Heyndrickxia oleronia]|uniref:YqaJ viral recombinase domain-containing protein n=1 Tax=Heyndrickxia oleronia TaxID=38875 RepID=A0AAW6STF5_9BACI|nr:hypothetical protein [Heyndrickxia oleronia]MDH5159859.1 hypothetical protein [Heyndrickxia oleronia]